MRSPIQVTDFEYFCDQCGEYIGTGDNVLVFHDSKENDFCVDCALKNGLIDAMAWLDLHGFGLAHHATYEDGKVIAFLKCGRGFSKYEARIGKA